MEKSPVFLDRRDTNAKYTLLTPDSREDSYAFSKVVNSEWRSLLNSDRKILEERFDSGELFVGGFYRGEPAGILETAAFAIPVPDTLNDAKYRARAEYVCRELVKRGSFLKMTDNGKWKPHPKNANVILLVDLTVLPEYQRGTPVSSGLVDATKMMIHEMPEGTPEWTRSLDHMVTFSPKTPYIKKLHENLGAFDTEVISPNARPNYVPTRVDLRYSNLSKDEYNPQDVRFMCHMSLPGYPMRIFGHVELQKQIVIPERSFK